jgi:hypothetical protein
LIRFSAANPAWSILSVANLNLIRFSAANSAWSIPSLASLS